MPTDLPSLFRDLTTAHVADACLRSAVEVRCAPAEVRPIATCAAMVVGRALPTRHYGSVDVFLEALEQSAPGDILVVDNEGRRDESCVGDLITLEAHRAGLGAIVIWGLHRDTAELLQIGLPVFSTGAIPAGPLQLRPREPKAPAQVQIGTCRVDANDLVLADADGVLFISADKSPALAAAARAIRETEHAQAAQARAGRSLREQFRFAEYLAQRAATPSLTFRQHLRRIGGAVEE